jgi:hypothetical protein
MLSDEHAVSNPCSRYHYRRGKKRYILNQLKETPHVRFKVKDFPEHGMFIISPSDSSFISMMAELTKGKSDLSLHSLKTFS